MTDAASRPFFEALGITEAELFQFFDAYDRVFACSVCGRPQGTHALCGGTWVPGSMMIRERIQVVGKALRAHKDEMLGIPGGPRAVRA